MFKIILKNEKFVEPFNEPARDLRIVNKPLWLNQRDVLAPYTTREIEVPLGLAEGDDCGQLEDLYARRIQTVLKQFHEPCVVLQDNLFFDEHYMKEFMRQAQRGGKAVRAAFPLSDGAFREHCLPLSTECSYHKGADDWYYAPLWFFPDGYNDAPEPLYIDLLSKEIGYYNIPTYMAADMGDLVYQVPLRSFIAIESWVHIFIADCVFGMFGRGARFEDRLDRDPFFKLGILWKGLMEGKQVLESSGVVEIGKHCVIDPTAVIHGPTKIGDNVTINAGAVIENCTIGDHVNIGQGCQLMLSVVGDGTFLPFRASLFMSSLMDNAMVAQNACLQMCVIGRDSFIGAGNTFTDFNLLSGELKARDGSGRLVNSNRPVLGGCVGHHVRIGAGMIIYPARTIESDVVLIPSERRIVMRDVRYEDSDHHKIPNPNLYTRKYPRRGEAVEEW
ncbi:MAG: multidrug transporter [Anaerolineae bacterium]|nr:multidrug transporter [Anaerolineae bacterium]